MEPALEVRMVRENLALAMAQWAGAKKGLITIGHLPTGKAFVPTDDGNLVEIFNPLVLTSNLDLARCASNQVRCAVAFSAMLTHGTLEQTFGGPPREDLDLDFRGAWCAIYLLHHALSGGMLSPVWECPQGYRSRFEVGPISFVLDASDLDGKPVSWEHFGGLEKYLELLAYCADRLEEPPPQWVRPDGETAEGLSNGSARPALSPTRDLSVAAFLEAACVVDPESYAIAGALYSQYLDWCRDAGQTPLAQRRFGIALTKLGFERKRRGRGRHWWKGLEPARVGAG